MSPQTITVPGEPLPKERPRMGRHGGVYTPRTTVAYENAIGFMAKAAGWKYGTQRLVLDMHFLCGKKENAKDKPDIDNLIKAVMDGLQRGGAFKNDKQVCELHACRSMEVDEPRVIIRISTF